MKFRLGEIFLKFANKNTLLIIRIRSSEKNAQIKIGNWIVFYAIYGILYLNNVGIMDIFN